MATILRQIALVSQTPRITLADLAVVSAAIQKQVTRDLAPIWEVDATVDAVASLDDIPPGYWPIFLVDTDPRADQTPIGGVHLDANNQPFAVIKFMANWSLIVSHEVLEMLVDPFGNRLMAGASPDEDQGRVEFLVEVCDPCQAADFSYTSNGIVVSNFYTPHYFDPLPSAGVRYTAFGDAITKPRQVLRGGYLSWFDAASDQWWQETFFSGSESRIDPLPQFADNAVSLRAEVDRLTDGRSLKAMMRGKAKLAKAAKDYAEMIARQRKHRVPFWRKQLEPWQPHQSAEGTPAARPRRPRRPAKPD